MRRTGLEAAAKAILERGGLAPKVRSLYVGPLTRRDGSMIAEPKPKTPALYVFVLIATREPVRVGQSAGWVGRVHDHARNADGWCSESGIDTRDLFVIAYRMPGSTEKERLEIERRLKRAYGLTDRRKMVVKTLTDRERQRLLKVIKAASNGRGDAAIIEKLSGTGTVSLARHEISAPGTAPEVLETARRTARPARQSPAARSPQPARAR